MVSGFICGTSSLPRDEDDEYERHTRSADSSPTKTRSKSTGGNTKNPYSNRGLDRFSALLSEIEEKRQQVYSQVDPNEISLVRFVYAGDHEFKPIVIKAKPKGIVTSTDHQTDKKKQSKHADVVVAQKSSSPRTPTKRTFEAETENNEKNKFDRRRLWVQVQPRFYLAVVFVLILVVLVVFGRSFAIMCTSIGWYLIPTITNTSNSRTIESSNSKALIKRKDFAVRRLSDKKVMSSEGTKSFKHPQERHNLCRMSV